MAQAPAARRAFVRLYNPSIDDTAIDHIVRAQTPTEPPQTLVAHSGRGTQHLHHWQCHSSG
jgi:hypothetical protein